MCAVKSLIVCDRVVCCLLGAPCSIAVELGLYYYYFLFVYYLYIIYYYFLTLGTYDPEGDEKLRKWIYKLGYDYQSVRSVVGKLSCRRTAL